MRCSSSCSQCSAGVSAHHHQARLAAACLAEQTWRPDRSAAGDRLQSWHACAVLRAGRQTLPKAAAAAGQPGVPMFDGSDRKRRVALSGRSRTAESGPEALRRLNTEREERRRAAAERRAATVIQVAAEGRSPPQGSGLRTDQRLQAAWRGHRSREASVFHQRALWLDKFGSTRQPAARRARCCPQLDGRTAG